MIRIALSKEVIQKRFLAVLISLAIYVAFYSIYSCEISPSNIYLSLFFRHLSPTELFISIIFYLIPLLLLPLSLERPSDISLWFLYLFSYGPTAMMCFHVSCRSTASMICFLSVMLFALITVQYSRYHSVYFHCKKPLNLRYLDKIIVLMFFFVVSLFALKMINFSLDLGFSAIYERRMFARHVEVWFSGYVLSVGRSLLTVLGVYLALVHKKRIYGIFVVVFALAVFSFDGTKTAIVIPFVLSSVYLIYSRVKSLLWMPFFTVMVVIASLLEFFVGGSNILSEIVTRRVIAVPGFLNTAYWDFFSAHEKVLLTDSIGRYFIGPIYNFATPYIIGLEYVGNILTNASTGIWMGGFAHFGVIGIFAVSAIGGFILGLIDNLTRSGYFMLGTLTCGYVGMNWCEQMLHTSMLTGGVCYLVVFLMFAGCVRQFQPELPRFR